MNLRFKATTIAVAIGLALTCGAYAQSTDADEKALASAQADLERAAQRVAELSGKLGHAGHGPMRMERRVMRQPVLGVVLAPDAQAGVHVAAVTPDSGAAKAGLRSGDRLVSIDGKSIAGAGGVARVEQAQALLGDLDVQRPLAVTYERDGKPATIQVMPRIGERVVVIREAPGGMKMSRTLDIEGDDDAMAMSADGVPSDMDSDAPYPKMITENIRHEDGGDVREIVIERAPGIAPEMHREVIRLGDCRGDDCRMPMLAEAFRWNGLNLASVDPQLGHYFGADSGVLVLSAGPALGELQPGDIVRKVDGRTVMSPRETMAALQAHASGSKVAVEYLRDRKVATTTVTVPKAMQMKMRMPMPPPPPPPAPPAPPAPPSAMSGGVAPMPPMPPDVPLPPAPPAPTVN